VLEEAGKLKLDDLEPLRASRDFQRKVMLTDRSEGVSASVALEGHQDGGHERNPDGSFFRSDELDV
jgi:hypothetical protein